MNRFIRLAVVAAFLSSLIAHGQVLTTAEAKDHVGETATVCPPITIAGDHFVRDGKPYQIISGSIHYVRVPRAYWRDRLQKARAMGLNTVETYAFWNLHEPKPGVFDFSGQLDIAAFIRMAQRG